MEGWKSSLTEGCKKVGSQSVVALKPWVAYFIAEFMVITKSGAALWLGNKSPRPPLLMWRWHISFEWVGISFSERSCFRKELIASLMPDVSGPFHVGQSSLLKSNGSLCIMSDPSRWGNFWSVLV